MEFKAFKMDGLGNDFVIIDKRKKTLNLSKADIIKITDRNFIGCDQLIYINPSDKFDAELEFFNPDGGKSDACGNGTRCVAYFLSKEEKKNDISLKTEAGLLKSKILNDYVVTTNIGAAKFGWKEIPLSKELDNKNLKIKILDNNKKELTGGYALSVGNPHLIFFVENCENFNLKKIGPELENHIYFPKKCNVTLAQVLNKKLIKVKVWERGAGLTKACGTAACATVVAAVKMNFVDKTTDVEFKDGKISINIDEENTINMKGKVSEIKEISIKI